MFLFVCLCFSFYKVKVFTMLCLKKDSVGMAEINRFFFHFDIRPSLGRISIFEIQHFAMRVISTLTETT